MSIQGELTEQAPCIAIDHWTLSAGGRYRRGLGRPVPLIMLVLFFQRHIIESLTQGRLKE